MPLPFLVSYIALWILVFAQAAVLLGLVAIVNKQKDLQVPGRDRASIPGLAPGSPLPPFEARDLDGQLLRSGDVAGALTALLFVSPTCPSCVTTLEEIVGLGHKARGNVAVICRADVDECSQLAATYGLVRTIPDPRGELLQLFGVQVLPTAVLIDRAGRVLSYGQPLREKDLDGDLAAVIGETHTELQRVG